MADKPKLRLTPALRTEYRTLFENCVIRPQYRAEIDHAADGIVASKTRYAALAAETGVPWTLIGVIHSLECNLSFNKHLHNGDPLSAKTIHEPKNRPPGSPPWTWEESARDALTAEGYAQWTDWTLAGTLFKLELYNGAGYRLYHPSVLTPYLWSYSTHYTMGKYGSDGLWNPNLVSRQAGAAVLLRRLAEKGENGFTDDVTTGLDTLVVPFMTAMPTDPAIKARAVALQQWLTTHTGVYLSPDGWAGENTSDAYRKVTGHYLPQDPRG